MKQKQETIPWYRELGLIILLSLVCLILYRRSPAAVQPGILRLAAAGYFLIVYSKAVERLRDSSEGTEFRPRPWQAFRAWLRRLRRPPEPPVCPEFDELRRRFRLSMAHPKYFCEMLEKQSAPEQWLNELREELEGRRRMTPEEIAKIIKRLEELT